MAISPNDLTFLVETDDGPVCGVVSPSVLAKLSGRSHITGAELLQVLSVVRKFGADGRAEKRRPSLVWI